MSDAQTEARAIETVRDWLNGGCSSWGLPSQQIETLLTALTTERAAHAETKRERDESARDWRDAFDRVHKRVQAAEAQLAEARMALERIEVRTRSVPSDTAEDDKRDKYHANSIARRALTGGKNG